jgi:cyclopropane fatty-acyl-phospholipid synthase-like methyltransferase
MRVALKRVAYSGPRRERWQHPERVIAALQLRGGERVADLGAGGGYFAPWLASAVGPDGLVYAVDTDPDITAVVAQEVARHDRTNLVPVPARSHDPDLPEPVDLVVLVNAFHHIPEPATYFRTLAGYLRPGGRVAVIESVPRWFLFGHATAPDQIRSVLADAGYVPAGSHDFLPRQSFQLFTVG